MEEIDRLVQNAIEAYMTNNQNGATKYLIEIYRRINSKPSLINQSRDLANLGKSFLLMLDRKLSQDVDVLQRIATVGYFCLSKAIKEGETNPYVSGDRQLMVFSSYDTFKYTIMSMNNSGESMMNPFFNSGLSDLEARDFMMQLEFFDIISNPTLALQNQYYKNRLLELTDKLENGFFGPIRTPAEMVNVGVRKHDELYNYLSEKILEEGDLDF